MPRATVLIPTHDHADPLLRALASAQGQSVGDLEIFVVGDGVPDRTRELVAEAVRGDPRIRFFDRPKGERHGELHRHEALGHASGRIVAYLSDDDLWLPEHVETLEAQLGDADLAHTLAVRVDPSGRFEPGPVDVGRSGYLEMLRGNHGGFGLPCAGHRLDAYRRLPYGWRPAPSGINSDAYMWVQWLEQPWCRARSVMRPTVLRFPAGERRDWSPAARLAELDAWREALQEAEGRERFLLGVIDALGWNRIHQLDDVRRELDRVRAWVESRAPASRFRRLVERWRSR